MTTPLNPSLYRKLHQLFKQVKITSQGVAFSAVFVEDPLTGRSKSKGSCGEYYMICCPCCRDTRFRLWINHRWGTVVAGKRRTDLAVCYNEHCECTQDFQHLVVDRLTTYRASEAVGEVVINQGRIDTGVDRVEAPEGTLLHQLPDSHPGVAYMLKRGFSKKLLGETYGVRWCDSPGWLRTHPHHHLFFPIYGYDDSRRLRLLGGQTRFLDPVTGRDKIDKGANEEKWWTIPGTKKSRLLYNGFRCKESPIVVIGEGPLDAIRAGPFAGVATFGKQLSQMQRDMLWSLWGKRGAIGVLGLDYDAWLVGNKDHDRTARMLLEMEANMRQTWHGGVVKLRFTADCDMGATPTDDIWKKIDAELRLQNRGGVADAISAYANQEMLKWG